MFLIKRLWIDTMENQDAYGFKDVGVVTTKEEAIRICNLEFVPKAQHPWPLNYASEFKGNILSNVIGISAGYLTKKVLLGSTHSPHKKNIRKGITICNNKYGY